MERHLSELALERYADRELGLEEARAAQRHLEGCPDCRTRLAEWEGLFLRIASVPALSPAPAFTDRVMARVAAARAAAPAAAWAPLAVGWARRLWPAAAVGAAIWTASVGGLAAWLTTRVEVGPGELLSWAVARVQDGFWTLLVRVAGAANWPALEVNWAALLVFVAFLTLTALWGARVLVRYATPATKVRTYA